MNKYSGWDPGVDVSDDLDIPPESGPPLRGFAHSERCAKDTADILAIEREAAQQERERLRKVAEQAGHRSTSGPVPIQCPACMSPACFIIDGILADPEDDQ